MTDSGLTLTQQVPANAAAVIDVRDDAPTDVWAQIADTDGVFSAVMRAILDAADGRTLTEYLDTLEAAGVPDEVASACIPIARGEEDSVWDLRRRLPKMAGGRTPAKDALGSIAGILRVSDVTPTLAVRLHPDFRSVRRSQRETLLGFISSLSKGCDIRVVCTGLTQRWLAQEHRADLPGVSEYCIIPPEERADEELPPIAECVERAWADFDPDGREVAFLRDLRETPAETLTRQEAYAGANVTEGRIRQVISACKQYGLIATFESGEGEAVELLPAGRAYLDDVAQSVGQQETLDAAVSEVSHHSDDGRVTPGAHVGGEEGTASGTDRHRLPHSHRVTARPRWQAVGAWASAPSSGMALVEYPVEAAADRGEGGWYYLKGKDALVVSAEYSNPLQYWVCVARALASSRTFNRVLTPERFEEDGGERELQKALGEYRDVLRETRCLGYFPDRIETAEEYRDALLAAEDDLCELTKQWHHDDYEGSAEAFRALVTREALGLAMTMTHLLDMAGVEVVREVRVPDFSQSFGPEKQAELAETLAVGASIGSRYKQFAAHRQLHETRESKLRWSFPPTVDADDPIGELIGRVTVVADFGGKKAAFADRLQQAVENPRPLREDAPEFGIEVPIQSEMPPEAYTRAAERLLQSQKGMRLTREAISALRAFLDTPYDVAHALRNLAGEEWEREIRLDEVRFALAHLPAERITPWFNPGARRILHALITSMEGCSVTEVCERADVSRSTWYRHKDALQAADFIRETDETGWRVALPHHGSGDGDHSHERHETILPLWAHPEGDWGDWVVDVAEEIVDRLLDAEGIDHPPGPGDPSRDAFLGIGGDDPDLTRLGKRWAWLPAMLRAVRDVLDLDRDLDGGELGIDAAADSVQHVLMGNTPQQASLQAAASSGDGGGGSDSGGGGVSA